MLAAHWGSTSIRAVASLSFIAVESHKGSTGRTACHRTPNPGCADRGPSTAVRRDGRVFASCPAIFLLSTDHRPENPMMKKIFDRFLDRPTREVEEIASAWGTRTEERLPVTLMSHHMRLLGVLCRKSDGDTLVLVDYDDTE